jgi:hypothetical protein
MVEYITCHSAPALHWGLLPATRLASRKIAIEQNVKSRTGPALYVFSLLGNSDPPTPTVSCMYNVYIVGRLYSTFRFINLNITSVSEGLGQNHNFSLSLQAISPIKYIIIDTTVIS